MRVLFIAITVVLVAACSVHEDTPYESPPTDTLAADSVNARSLEHAAEGDTTTYMVTDSTISLRRKSFPSPGGRVVNIAITGLDSRLGQSGGRADANHIIRLFLDSAMVEIISIPRDSEYDAGYDDTTTFNKLANVHANKGRKQYHQALCDISGCERIDYWVELGFSQAIGVLELLGFRGNANQTLEVLRSRQAFRSGDFQRAYNQGQFMRQMMLKHFGRLNSFLGDIALRAGLALVDTDLNYDVCNKIIVAFSEKGFGEYPDKVWVRLAPSVYSNFQYFEFSTDNVSHIHNDIRHKIRQYGVDTSQHFTSMESRLLSYISKAEADSARPSAVISHLQRPYHQRAWLQISDTARRTVIRNRMCGLLISAYERTRRQAKAAEIRGYLELEDAAKAGD